MNNSPLLTICIPSYNRGQRVYALVLNFLELVGDALGQEVEILVANNHSTDETLELLSPLARSGLNIHTHATHYPTSELNMFHSLELCRGEYVWFHGDDDVPATDSIMKVLEQIRADAADILCFNSAMLTMQGQFAHHHILPMNGAYLDTEISQATQALGFTFYVAGITNIVFRRTMASKDLALKIYALQPIYSHVAWVYLCFKGKRLRIMNYPLVCYRLSAAETVDHFRRYAEKNQISVHTIWGFGMIKLLSFLVENHALSPVQVGRIMDMQASGARVRIIDATIHRMYEQLALAITQSLPRNQVTMDEFQKARDFLYRVDPANYDLLVPLEELCSLANTADKTKANLLRVTKLSETFSCIFNAQAHENVYRAFFQGSAYNYRIYKCVNGYVALSPHAHHDREAVLRWIDPLENIPHCFISPDYDALVARIAEYLCKNNMSGSQSRQYEPLAHALHQINSTMHEMNYINRQQFEVARQYTFPLRLIWKSISWFKNKALRIRRFLS